MNIEVFASFSRRFIVHGHFFVATGTEGNRLILIKPSQLNEDPMI